MTAIDTTKPQDTLTQEPTVSETKEEAFPTHEEKKTTPVLQTRVSFHKVEIREYSRCIGDNPATTHGPPLSIDWEYNVAGSYAVDEYEETRPPRRVSHQMVVPGAIREDILSSHAGVTKKEIQKVTAEVKATRHRRKMSVALQEVDDWMSLGEAIARRLRRLRTGISKKREQELLWENAQRIMKAKSTPSSSNQHVVIYGTPSDDGSTTEETDELSRPSMASSLDEIEAANQ